MIHKIENVEKDIALQVNTNKTEFMSIHLKNTIEIKSLNGDNIKLVNDFKIYI